MIRVEQSGNAADMPGGGDFAPDGGTQDKGGLPGGGRLKTPPKPRNGPTVIVDDHRQPGTCGLALIVDEPEVHEGMIRLPDGIRVGGFAAIDQIKSIAIHGTSFMGKGDEGRVQM